ncbi:MAG: sodium:solute symporter family protein, partial [Pseudomonadota bacterium]
LAATILGYPKTTRCFVAGAIGGFVTALLWNELLGKPFLIEGFVIGAAVNVALFVLVPAARARSESS